MYARYTAFEFDEPERERVLAFWRDVGAPSAAAQPGFELALVLESEEAPGRLRTVTLWRARADFDAYYASPHHGELGGALKESGLRIVERDGLAGHHHVTPRAEITRVTRARLRAGGAAKARRFWSAGGADLIRGQPGCVGARAHVDEERDALVVAVDWRTQDDAERYLVSDDHKRFAAGMDAAVEEVVERQFLRPLD